MAEAQTNSSSYTNSSGLCDDSISNANASGIFTFPVQYPLEDQNRTDGASIQDVRDPSWAITVTGGHGKKVKRLLWYDTARQNYADDLGINYGVCALIISRLPEYTLRLGQEDSGKCSSMFTERCIDGLTSVASKSAHNWISYSSPPPYQNLTDGVLPPICNYILSDLRETMESECGPELAISESNSATDGAVTNIQALTGFDDSGCTLSGNNKTFRPVSITNPANTDWRCGTDVGCDNATHEVTPILTVYMPVANVDRTSVYSIAPSVLQCVRSSNFSESSRVSPALAEGTPWPKASGSFLSARAKGGIVAGVIVFVLIVCALLLCLWLVRRKKRARAAAAASQPDAPTGEDDKNLPPEADDSHGVHELHRELEIDGVTVSELGGGGGKPSELINITAPVELSTESAVSGL